MYSAVAVIYVLNAQEKASEIATLEFDKPLWDYDYLKIYDITKSEGNLIKIYERSIKPKKDNHSGLTKICRFIELIYENIKNPNSRNLANMEQGLLVQKIVLSLVEYNTTSDQELFEKNHEITQNILQVIIFYLIQKDESN
ncbi:MULTISPECIES: hypothetical protein [Symbiopectobacterium]|uniref:hypothetical protein n=1 Tax=Symbiopectobacterium TaxID=801 RepID=UPI001A269997|nr:MULTISPECIES: hypothetical protein [Symbiopectobacterium]MBG6248403.1 hypothetical protein [Candidatus Symbiopectobacterium sp. PLON1]MBT9429859.1 hypothetical protein [Candidatus Symbiopectobacterium endolongispinus]